MFNIHALPDQQKSFIQLIIIVATLFIPLASCTSVESPYSDNTRPANTQPDNLASRQSSTASTGDDAPDNSNGIDQTTDNWAKARAVYLRSLDYEQIDLQKNSNDQYFVKSNLVESRYHIKDSADALYIEHNARKARQELREAVQQYSNAITKAPANMKDKLIRIKNDLESLLKEEKKLITCTCRPPRREAYSTIESEIESLLTES
jgi:hypothetical protein